MILTITADNGDLVGVIENLEKYNLDKIIARTDLVNGIRDLVLNYVDKKMEEEMVG